MQAVETVTTAKVVRVEKPVNKIKFLLLLFLFLALLLTGCSKEGFYEGMYRGLQQREDIVHSAPATDPFSSEQPSYDDYRREREEAL